MSYHPDGPGLGIGTGIGTQAMAGLGSCCAPCASGAKRCGAAGLGDAASRAAGRDTTTTAPKTTKPAASKTAPPLTLAVSPSVLLVDPGQTVTALSPVTQLPSGGMSTLAKVAIAGLLVGGGVLVYRRIKNRKK